MFCVCIYIYMICTYLYISTYMYSWKREGERDIGAIVFVLPKTIPSLPCDWTESYQNLLHVCPPQYPIEEPPVDLCGSMMLRVLWISWCTSNIVLQFPPMISNRMISALADWLDRSLPGRACWSCRTAPLDSVFLGKKLQGRFLIGWGGGSVRWGHPPYNLRTTSEGLP